MSMTHGTDRVVGCSKGLLAVAGRGRGRRRLVGAEGSRCGLGSPLRRVSKSLALGPREREKLREIGNF